MKMQNRTGRMPGRPQLPMVAAWTPASSGPAAAYGTAWGYGHRRHEDEDARPGKENEDGGYMDVEIEADAIELDDWSRSPAPSAPRRRSTRQAATGAKDSWMNVDVHAVAVLIAMKSNAILNAPKTLPTMVPRHHTGHVAANTVTRKEI